MNHIKLIKKYREEINNHVENFVKTFDEEYSTVMGDEFYVYLDENLICWTLICDDEGAIAFEENFRKHFPIAKNFDVFTLSILHEIGHLETEDEMIDDTQYRNSEKITNEEYFKLHNERIATEWAGDWLEENYSIAKNFENKLHKLLNEFYKAVITE